MKKLILIVFVTAVCFAATAQRFYDVTKYGAKNDSSKLATKPIADAIAAASKAGGGTVYFPAGKYLTGPIHLKSKITILIDAGAELHFSDNFDDYLPMVQSRYEGVDVMSFSPLFYAYKAENIAITGRGTINGHGQKWWNYALTFYKNQTERNKYQLLFDSLNKDILLPDDPTQMKRGFLRPPFIQPLYCKNVLIEGVTITNSPFWTVTPEFCENVTIKAVTINNPPSPNTDGINPSSCRYVHISDCHISVGDDCITIKSGKDLPGRTKATPAENYTITNCTMLSGHGGVVIGSEMSGDVKKIVISNCVFDGTDRGIRIKTARGRGGVVEDIRVDNIVMKNIKAQAIVLDMEYAKTQPAPVSERTPQFRNIRLSNITAYTKQAMFINGLDEMPVSEISLNDCVFEAETGITIRNAKDIELHNVRVNTKTGSPLSVEKAERITVNGFVSAKPLTTAPLIRLTNVQDVLLMNNWPFSGTKTFAEIKGASTKNILFKNNMLGEAAMVVADDVKKDEVKQ
ncbi:polygalacturonase [Lacibacter cauensis]|uniref:Polygalacturonase n=1 Tax=Lacibacter cauensis TaxID=510947 RepID=A0A562SVD3_9BACT|nr:glycoside hydrolase family 28 protein [Lacibacter cauensis]TWI85133.1 polygalacturonase [Lacibacter cauensis]